MTHQNVKNSMQWQINIVIENVDIVSLQYRHSTIFTEELGKIKEQVLQDFYVNDSMLRQMQDRWRHNHKEANGLHLWLIQTLHSLSFLSSLPSFSVGKVSSRHLLGELVKDSWMLFFSAATHSLPAEVDVKLRVMKQSWAHEATGLIISCCISTHYLNMGKQKSRVPTEWPLAVMEALRFRLHMET